MVFKIFFYTPPKNGSHFLIGGGLKLPTRLGGEDELFSWFDVLSSYFQDLHSLKLTASLPLKIDDWKVPILSKIGTCHFFPGAFSGNL